MKFGVDCSLSLVQSYPPLSTLFGFLLVEGILAELICFSANILVKARNRL